MSIWPMRYEYFFRKIKFLHRLKKQDNNLLITCFKKYGNAELQTLYDRFNITNKGLDSIKDEIWQCFEATVLSSD